MYTRSNNCVRINEMLSKWFNIEQRLGHECRTFPSLLNVIMHKEYVMAFSEPEKEERDWQIITSSEHLHILPFLQKGE